MTKKEGAKVLARHNARALGGFTLIELLVVIAIIGILAGIILVSLNTARSKANDAAVKANLAGARSAMEIYYDGNSPNGYANAFAGNGVCAGGGATEAATYVTGLPGGSTAVCRSDASGYMISADLPSVPSSNPIWCVDSTGFNGAIANDPGDTTCQ